MKYEWIDEYCVSKQGAEKDYKVEWDAVRFMIRGKMFAMKCGDKEGKPIITIKLEPLLGEFFRNQYPDIVPGYYMNKQHWNSLYLEGNVPDDVVRDMLNKSYNIILQSFSKKIQQEILDKIEV